MTPRLAMLLVLTLLATAVPGQVIDSIDVGGRWVGSLAYNPTGDVIYGASEDGRFFTIDVATNQLLSWIGMPSPFDVVYNAIDNKAYCTFGPVDIESVLVVDGSTHGRIKAISMPGATRLVWDADSDRLYVSCDVEDYVGVIDCRTDSVIATIPCPGGPLGMDINTRHRKLYVRNWDNETVSVIDMVANQLTRSVAVGNTPQSGWYCRALDKYYCGTVAKLLVMPGANDTFTGDISLPHSGIVSSLAGQAARDLLLVGVDAVGVDSVFTVDTRGDSVCTVLPVGREPSAMVWSSASDLAYCANAATDDVSVIDGDRSRVVATVGVGDCPAVVQPVPAHRRVYVGHSNTRWVYVLRDTALGVSEGAGTVSRPCPALRAEPSVFWMSTVVTYAGAYPTRADLNVFAESGELVRSIRPRSTAGGRASYRWDGRDSEGRDAPEGVYFLAAVGKTGSGIKVVKVR